MDNRIADAADVVDIGLAHLQTEGTVHIPDDKDDAFRRKLEQLVGEDEVNPEKVFRVVLELSEPDMITLVQYARQGAKMHGGLGLGVPEIAYLATQCAHAEVISDRSSSSGSAS